MIKFQSTKREPFRLDLVPMINIVFLLLIFFMLTSTAMKRSNEVQLPEAETSELNTKPNLVILVSSNGKLEFDGQPIELDALLPKLEEQLRDRKEKILEIQADKDVEFESFSGVIDVAKQAGAVDFILATEKPGSPGK